ncbi:protein PAL OF QUIRKY isoform X2 [Malania oleifera]|uniref:protein PAL OF QUIRKY isoform X2 n=1 Tax=Malania oleifera TaxID=397392 RepID=UPI0025AE8A70|nr:protein PAL OF QUIRKY isoform X2 [Malania oleifera]XP_057949222.1 protein PAL OF QUIRKY isoform X2 [Malania oleifera]XP_057949223.1 protein PAL OF QUIRKY isoform X2 [Malania oleifera]XP_057949224.1 protein PAL OF QUIRKY isoform X2 [Malania oleifera]XP_057949225.1 protein PAL OF QUIRKY isoform X2 [Malania oleifera]XP_057949226.1 protein PAL OF QUIRKY isoform X2 [Malania oleifera]
MEFGASPDAVKPPTIKFLCSYGGKILPRYPDGKLRYHGGDTRVLAVHRSVSFSELLVKLGDLCGSSVSLRCQLPTEDLDALVSITSDEDLANLIEEYDRAASISSATSSSIKIRAFLSPPKSLKKISPPPSSAPSSKSSVASASRFPAPAADPRFRQVFPRPVVFPLCFEKSSAGKVISASLIPLSFR